MHIKIQPGVAANHPQTADVGARVLTAGGSAADAAVAAALASCVTETFFTGLGGGGFATYYEAATGHVTCLDFFVAIPGLDSSRKPEPMTHLDISFGGARVPYEVGGASIAVPGMPAGCAELHRRFGRLPWAEIVEPAIELARTGAVLTPEHLTSLVLYTPVMLTGDGVDIYAPGGKVLTAGELIIQPGLAEALTTLSTEGADVFYTGQYAELLLETVTAEGGVMTETDLRSYKVVELSPITAGFVGHDVHGRL
ncbi:MAG: gamma-glutamyltransferase, partial [Longispora sp.]|nr:gamma-glutamyltransferase [Longispora sp. (in: high G+C Gram-positive bacteria)]